MLVEAIFMVYWLSRDTTDGSPVGPQSQRRSLVVYLNWAAVLGLSWLFQVTSFIIPGYSEYNVVTGVIIFLLLLFLNKIYRHLNRRYLLLALAVSCITFATVRNLLQNDFYTFPEGIQLTDGQQFDYIVVGAGAGGAPAAARLALAGQHVLLVEAGGDPNPISKVPAAAMQLLGTDLDWQYETISNNVSCLSSVGQQCRFSRGKCLGGSTSINYMIYTRGNRKDFDDITSPGWTYNDLMPYFLRYEGLQDVGELPTSSRPYHNTTGAMRTGFFGNSLNPWHSRLIDAFQSLNFPYNPDVNAKSQIGVTQVHGYVYKGERMSTARGYLAREDVKRTLKVAKNTVCTGVIVDENNIARGVEAVQGTKNLKLYARQEIILSAGAIGTPQILMLSGIGPADHLKRLGIPVKADLPVGEGMTDHDFPLLIIQVKRKLELSEQIQLLGLAVRHVNKWLIAREGVLTSNGLTDVCIFVNTHCYDFKQRRLLTVSSDGSDCEVPNLQILNAYFEKNLISLVKPLFKKITGFKDYVIEQLAKANKEHAFILMSPMLLKPRSSGTVRLASKSPSAPPAIYPNYLSDKSDVDEMVRSINIIEQVAETVIFKQHMASLLLLDLPGCPRHEVDKRSYWRCYARHMTLAGYHAAGTAPLGAVLDERLRVRGVRRLRVADLSAVPRVPTATTEAVTVAIGERVTDFVLEDNYN